MEELLNIFKRAEHEPEIKRLLSEVWEQLDDSELLTEDYLPQKKVASC